LPIISLEELRQVFFMKNFIKSICVSTVICIIFSLIPFNAQCKNISNEVFRLHILANSDSEKDQSLKLKVRDRVLKYTEKIYKNAQSKAEAEKLTIKNLQSIADTAKKELVKNGCNYSVKAEIRHMYFDTRYYDKVTMPSGFYNALRITIGKGEGHNWWCVMYPSLCVGSSTDYNSLKENTDSREYSIMTEEKYEYKFKTLEYFEKICSFFS
jgi:stage II sporulation protein R